jgi:hypothetical protein
MPTKNEKPENPIAFPRTAYDSKGDITTWGKEYEGMTLRDYFANSAMQGMLANSEHVQTLMGNNPNPVPDYVAILSYNLADAMLKQREL